MTTADVVYVLITNVAPHQRPPSGPDVRRGHQQSGSVHPAPRTAAVLDRPRTRRAVGPHRLTLRLSSPYWMRVLRQPRRMPTRRLPSWRRAVETKPPGWPEGLRWVPVGPPAVACVCLGAAVALAAAWMVRRGRLGNASSAVLAAMEAAVVGVGAVAVAVTAAKANPPASHALVGGPCHEVYLCHPWLTERRWSKATQGPNEQDWLERLLQILHRWDRAQRSSVGSHHAVRHDPAHGSPGRCLTWVRVQAPTCGTSPRDFAPRRGELQASDKCL
jgi:hypothetical protein